MSPYLNQTAFFSRDATMKTSSLKMITIFATVASLLVGHVALAKNGGGGGSSSHSSGSHSSSNYSSGSSKLSGGVKTSSNNSSKMSSTNKTSSNSGKTTKSNNNKTTSTNGSKTGKTSKTDSGKTASNGGTKKDGKNHGEKHSKHDKSCFSDYCHSSYGCYSSYCNPRYGCYSEYYCPSDCEPYYCETSNGEPSYPVYSDRVAPVEEQIPAAGPATDEVEGTVSETSLPADTTAAVGDDEVARTKVPAGSTLLVDGQEFGSKPGSARMLIGGGSVQVAVVEWTANSVKVNLPKADQPGTANVDLEIVRADGSIASRTSLEVNSVEEVASNN